MIYPSIRSLLQKVDNKYSLVVIAAKRARQLVDGKEPNININSNNSVTIATHEIESELIEFEENEGLNN